MKIIAQCMASLLMATIVTPIVRALPSVLTQDYDEGRSGANLSETILTPGNVSSAGFGRLFSYPVDEEIFAQPLYVPNLAIAGGTHNVVFLATMGNSVYAFDADSAATAQTPLWSVNLGAPIPSAKIFFFGGSGVSHNGIYSTPVIDRATETMYVVTHLWSVATQSITLQIHALDLTTGAEKFGGPKLISAAGFDPAVNEQRAGLLLLKGVVYVAMASHADLRENIATQKAEPYVGMVLAYNAATLALKGSFNAEAGGLGGSLWQGGRGLASDGTYIYGMTANAFTLGSTDYSESFVQLNPGTLSVAGYFQDPDATCMNTLDLDLASGGPQVIPGAGTNLLVGGGKEGKVYTLLLDEPLHSQTPAYFWGTSNHATLPSEGGTCADTRANGHGWLQGSDTAFWSNPGGTSYFYSYGNYDDLSSWSVSGNTFTQTSADTPVSTFPNALALSANGGTNGILWTVAPQQNGNAIVSAYNAVPSLGHLNLLWSSTQVVKRDAFGSLGRYSVPTIANGKVYVATGSNQVVAYGLLPTAPAIGVTPTSGTVGILGLEPLTQVIYANAIAGYTGTVTLSLSGLPSGVTYSFVTPSFPLTTAKPTVGTGLTISPAGAVLPLNDNYTITVTATGTGGQTGSAPIRVLMRSAAIPSATSAGCNGSNQMSVDLSWQINGSGVPAIWIQDPTTPNFPGRLWMDPSNPVSSADTPYNINNGKQSFWYWLIDQSAGLPATFDNALHVKNLGALYDCP
jgi:hypothetical protein